MLKKITNDVGYQKVRDFMNTRKVIFLTYGGSHAYGTNIETSDIDLRGIALQNKNELLGFENFEQFVCTESDTTIYGIKKIFQLLLNVNPNTIEMLGTKPEHHFIKTPESELILANKKLFLSKRCINSFGGYATAQLRRLENAMSRTMSQSRQEEHILNSIYSSLDHLQTHYTPFTDDDIKLYVGESIKDEYDTEIFIDCNLKRYPLRDFKAIQSEMNETVKNYSKISHRNNKKSEQKLDKHVMHLVRLYLMLFDILEKEEINTFRGDDIELLQDIRNGKYSDNEYSAIYEMLNQFEKRLAYAKENTSLPEKPDYNKVQELLVLINEKTIN